MKQPVSCGFLIVKGDPVKSFLLMKHPRRWDLPKGHVDPGETEMQCALRELEEETGIIADLLQVDHDFCYETQYTVNGSRYGMGTQDVQKTLKIFLGRLTTDVEIVVTEHAGYRWFPWSPPHNIQKRAIDPILRHLENYLATKSVSPQGNDS